MLCKICGSEADHRFSVAMLRRHAADFSQCRNCGFLFTPDPFWLEEAYEKPIADADTGLADRNQKLSRTVSVLLLFLFKPKGTFLDVAGGYGLFVRLMRDIGFDFYWSDKYCENLLAKGFEGKRDENYDVVTAFEVLEHLSDPLGFVRDVLDSSGADTIIFSTETFKGSAPDPSSWWYYAFETGQHISFYEHRTLLCLAELCGRRLYSNGSLHIFTTRNISPASYFLLSTTSIARLLSFFPRFCMKSLMKRDHAEMLARR